MLGMKMINIVSYSSFFYFSQFEFVIILIHYNISRSRNVIDIILKKELNTYGEGDPTAYGQTDTYYQ